MRIFFILSRHVHHFADSIKAGERFGNLCADGRELNQRHGHHAGEHYVHEKIANRHLTGDDGVSAYQNDHHSHGANDERRKSGSRGNTGHRLGDVPKELVRAAREG